jgi:hypothetical protein
MSPPLVTMVPSESVRVPWSKMETLQTSQNYPGITQHDFKGYLMTKLYPRLKLVFSSELARYDFDDNDDDDDDDNIDISHFRTGRP